jgi:hypothetical protein
VGDAKAARNAVFRRRGMAACRAIAPETVAATSRWPELTSGLIAAVRRGLRARARRTGRQEHGVCRATYRPRPFAVFQRRCRHIRRPTRKHAGGSVVVANRAVYMTVAAQADCAFDRAARREQRAQRDQAGRSRQHRFWVPLLYEERVDSSCGWHSGGLTMPPATTKNGL